jgi:enoyl-CoA hydratase/carnithine racemase
MQFIEVETRDRVTTITLNRPEVMNAINYVMHQELQDAFDTYASDPEQRVCVVTGAGPRAFCAGSDLKEHAESGSKRAYPPSGYAGLIERWDLDKPVIAAVNGLALGGGFEIALACDLIIASESASFGLPEPLVGAVALGGGLHRLVRQIGLKPAMGLILSSRRISADVGLRLGIVNEVVPADGLTEAVGRWCHDVRRASPMSIRASKQAAMRGQDEASLADAMRHQTTYPAWVEWQASDDAREGPRAFAEKRAPVWNAR